MRPLDEVAALKSCRDFRDKTRPRNRLEPLGRNPSGGLLAGAVAAVGDALERLLDLEQRVLFG